MKIDKLGRVVIPMQIRKQLKIADNDELEINVIDEAIVIRSSRNRCKICAKSEIVCSDLGICQSCISIIKAIK